MSPLPPFHTEAVAEARRRLEHAIEESRAAAAVVDEIDVVLAEPDKP